MGASRYFAMAPEGFTKRLGDAILESGLTRKQIAERTGVPLVTIHQMISYGKNPNFTSVARIAAEIGVSIDYLAYGRSGKDGGAHDNA